MKTFIFTLSALIGVANLNPLRAGAVPDGAIAPTNAEAVVEQMRGLNMQLSGGFEGSANRMRRLELEEQPKIEIERKLQLIGTNAVPALAKALKDPDAQMRRNSALVFIVLAGAYEREEPRPAKVDIRAATPDLIKALEDMDVNVRAWAAQALGEIGPDAKDAVPALIKLLSDSYEGCRNSGCLGLAHIGPAAKDALPALQKALDDPSKDVRRFAQRAIEQIQKK